MRAICINNGKIGYIDLEFTYYLVQGHEYELRDEEYDADRWWVFNDKKEWQAYKKIRFKVIEEKGDEG